MSDAPKKVREFLNDIQSISVDQFEIFKAVQTFFLNYDSTLEEAIKYGGLVFMQEGKLIGGIYAYQKHISIEFSHGTQLDDPFSVLDGSGKHRRHIKLRSFVDISNKHVNVYIENALNNANKD